MKEILNKYPISILRHELINVRTKYRLDKKKIIEILKTMKSIKKLTKNELIELLINHNYDISKLPKIEVKPEVRQVKPKVKKELQKEQDNQSEEQRLCKKYMYKKKEFTIDYVKEFNQDFKIIENTSEYKDWIKKNDEIKNNTEKLLNNKKFYDFISSKICKPFANLAVIIKHISIPDYDFITSTSVYDLYFKYFKEKMPTIDETNKIIDNLNNYYSVRNEKEIKATNEDKERLKEVSKIYYKLINNFDDIKKQLLFNKNKWDDGFREHAIYLNSLRKKVPPTPITSITQITEITGYKIITENEYIKMIDDYIMHKLRSFFTFYLLYPQQLELYEYKKGYSYSLNNFIRNEFSKDNNEHIIKGYDNEIPRFISNYLLL